MTGESVRRLLRPALQIGLPLLAAVLAATALAQQPPRPSGGSIKMPVVPQPAPAPPPPAASAPTATDKPLDTSEWMTLPIDDLRRRAHAGETRAMEELARRLVSGIGVPQDAQSGAGWLLRAAEAGAPGAAFNVGVMYERGFVVERDSTKAVEWYQKAVDGNVAVAKHNLALLLREGRGAPRDGKRAVELLQSAARQGMAASMFSLGDIYERGDVAPKDTPLALAWFAVAVEFERQRGHGAETPLARTAQQRIEALQRVLTPSELEHAQKLGMLEFHEIVTALTPKPEAAPPLPPLKPAPDTDESIGWPRTAIERARAVQQALIDLNLLRDKADGVVGPMTQTAIRAFEKSAGLPESGEPSREVYVALLRALQAHRDTVARSPLPPPPKAEPAKPEPPKPDPPKPPAVKVETAPPPPLRVELGPPPPAPPPPTSADIARGMSKPEPPKPEAGKPEAAKPETAKPQPAKPEPAKTEPARPPAAKVETAASPPRIDLGPPTPTPPPPTSADIMRLMPKPEPPKPPAAPPPPPIDLGAPAPPPPPPTSTDIARAMPDPEGWPANRVDQIRAIQALMGELKLINFPPSGELGPITLAALRDFQRKAGLGESGEPSRPLYLRLKEKRDAMVRAQPPPPPRRIELVQAEAPPPLTSAEIAKAAAASGPAPSQPAKATPEPEVARAQPEPQPKPDPRPWPANRTDQVRAIQALLREMKLMDIAPTGHVGPLTVAAIRDYQKMAGLPVTGEASQALFESLKEMRTMMERRATGKPR